MAGAPTGRTPRARSRSLRLAAYAWAAPTTLLGLAAGALTLLTGGDWERRDGVVEFRNAFARALLESRILHASAITLGHVILARDDASLERYRAHEHGHVRQAERLGPFFLPVYFLAAGYAALRGRHHYHGNWFEVNAEAFAVRQREAGQTERG